MPACRARSQFAALDQRHAQAAQRKIVRQRRAGGTAANYHHMVFFRHRLSPKRSEPGTEGRGDPAELPSPYGCGTIAFIFWFSSAIPKRTAEENAFG